MRRTALTAGVVSACCVVPSPSDGRDLRTRWAVDVSPARPRPQYPRPQLVRSRWKSLNGRWALASGERILVPFPPEAPLSGIGDPRPRERLRYRRTFTVPAAWRGSRVRLNFGAVDHDASVYVNGRFVGRHRGGYTPFGFDVTGALRRGPDARQSVVVDVRDPAGLDADQPLGKQLAKGRIFYTRTTGIWQSVWLEPVRPGFVSQLRLRSTLGSLAVDVSGAADAISVAVRSRGSRRVLAYGRTRGRSLRLAVPGARPWSPESPVLYDVAVRAFRGGRVVDRVRSYTAFRTVGVRNGFFELNGRPYVLRGVLDQGYWPDGVYTAPSDAALRHDVAAAKRFGFNLARKHVKVEDPRWYWWADRLGLLVAQDMPSAWDLRSAAARRQFSAEWSSMILALESHPSVALWIAFNENWGRPSAAFQSSVVDLARGLDGTRPVIDASGSVRRENSDMLDFHDYGEDLARYQLRAPRRARWIGEYGGLTLRVPGHVWGGGRGFRRRVRSVDGLVREYAQLTRQVNGAPGLSGFVYTQLYDVERELNGLMTYDRVLKVPFSRIAAVNRGQR